MLTAAFKQSIRNLPTQFVLGVSMGSKNHQGPALAAIVDCLNKTHLSYGVIDVSDTLARYAYQIGGAEEGAAMEQARAAGREWANDNTPILANLKASHAIVHWDRWLADPRFKSYRTRFIAAYQASSLLRDAIERDINAFYTRKFNQAALQRSASDIALSTAFYLEELAVMSMQFEDYPGAQIYPGKELECLKVVRAGHVPHVPDGIGKAKFYRLTLG